jgi:hypothetical protein
LQKELEDAEARVAAEKTNFDDMTDASVAAAEAKEAHRVNNAAYLTAYTDANDRVNALVGAAGGADDTDDMQDALNILTALTAAAESAVDDQRENIEALIRAKRTQDQEEALWEERVQVATMAESDATAAKNVADAAIVTA